MILLTAPSKLDISAIATKVPSVFLAGGISNCKDWQSYIVSELDRIWKKHDYIVYNPRREKFDIKDESVSAEQIAWEYWYIRQADIVTFWFTAETLCPITLFELGSTICRAGQQKIIIGIDPNYQRKFDIEKQVELYSKSHKNKIFDIEIVYSLEDVIKETTKYVHRIFG